MLDFSAGVRTGAMALLSGHDGHFQVRNPLKMTNKTRLFLLKQFVFVLKTSYLLIKRDLENSSFYYFREVASDFR